MWDFNDSWSLTGRIYKRTPKHDCKNVTKSCDLSFIWTWTAYYNGISSKYSMWMIAIFCYTCVSDQLRIPKVTLLNSCSFLWWSLNRLLKSFTSVSTFSFFFFFFQAETLFRFLKEDTGENGPVTEVKISLELLTTLSWGTLFSFCYLHLFIDGNKKFLILCNLKLFCLDHSYSRPHMMGKSKACLVNLSFSNNTLTGSR